MKNSRGLKAVILALTAGLSMLSCSSENEYVANEDEKDFYTVQLGMGGEWDVSYAPLSRAAAKDTNDIHGIQVYSAPDIELEENETVTWTPFAYGLFDNEDAMSINLLKGYKYKFVATIVKDGKKKINKGPSKGFQYPFNLEGYGSGECSISNNFNYKIDVYFKNLDKGSSFLYLSDLGFFAADIPNTDRYYGELEFTPTANAKANIKMKRASFGAKFIAKGKAAQSGSLEIAISGAPVMMFTPSADKNHISDIFTFEYVKKAWETNGNYSETLDVTINWHRTDGTIVPLGTHAITYKRNATTVVNVEVKDDSTGNDVGFDIEDSETGDMVEDENVTNIVDGEIVETEVGTN